MKTSYRERDYEYGVTMHKLRNAMNLTQEGLGKLVGVSRRAVAEWEAGCNYPKTEHLKALIELAVQHQAFSAGREAEEIRQHWKVAHQKVLLDENWLCALLSQRNSPQVEIGEIMQTSDTRQEIGDDRIGPRSDPVCPKSADPEPSADPVPCSNPFPPLTPVPPVEETMSNAVTAHPQREEAEAIVTPLPTGDMGSAQASGSVRDMISTIGARPNPRGDKTRGRNIRLLAIVLTLVIVAITGVGGMLLLQARNHQDEQARKIISTQTHSYPAYLLGNGRLSFFDPLSQQDGSRWRSSSINKYGGSCHFTGGTYRVRKEQVGSFHWCAANGTFSNFAFEVQLSIMQGSCGGMTFRDGDNKGFYKFEICENGQYGVFKYLSDSDAEILQSNQSSAIHSGLEKPNKIAVVAAESLMTFYVNEQQITQVQDSSYTWGRIALTAGSSTDAAYSNATLWTV